MPDTSNKSETRVRHEQHEYDTNKTIVTRVKNFDPDNATSEHIFSYPNISYMANKRLKEEELWKLHHKNWTLEWPKLYKKVTDCIVAANALSSSNKDMQSNTAPCWIKTILCGTSNIFFNKNYWKLGKMDARFWKNIYNKGKVSTLDSFSKVCLRRQLFAFKKFYMQIVQYLLD